MSSWRSWLPFRRGASLTRSSTTESLHSYPTSDSSIFLSVDGLNQKFQLLKQLNAKYLHSDKKTTPESSARVHSDIRTLIDTLRCIAEILIWGDQNDTTVFEMFLEKNVFKEFFQVFHLVLEKTSKMEVCIQLLQTLNILFENLKKDTSFYFILSNNHVNEIISHDFDFDNEEVLAYYISYLKTLSLKLNRDTVHFFFNEHSKNFPLFKAAMKFLTHPECMVKIAARTITLNVFKLDYRPINDFIISNSSDFIDSNHESLHKIESDLISAIKHENVTKEKIENYIDEYQELLQYITEILSSTNKNLQATIEKSLFSVLTVSYLTKIKKPHENAVKLLLLTHLISIVPKFKIKSLELLNVAILEESITLSFYEPVISVALIFIKFLMPELKKENKEEWIKFFGVLKLKLMALLEESIKIDSMISLTTVLQVRDLMKGFDLSEEEKDSLRHWFKDVESSLRLYFRQEKDAFADIFEQEVLYFSTLNKSASEVNTIKSSNLELRKLIQFRTNMLTVSKAICQPELFADFTAKKCEKRRMAVIYFVLKSMLEDTEVIEPFGSNFIAYKLNQQINLDNSDLASCYLDGSRKFMVIKQDNVLLVDPDPMKLGWAIIKRILPLSRIELKQLDAKSLLVVVNNVFSAENEKDVKLNFAFEDHIRCSAVRARLLRGRDLLLRDRQTWLSFVIGLNKLQPAIVSPTDSGQSTSPTPTPGRAIKIQSQTVELQTDVFTI